MPSRLQIIFPLQIELSTIIPKYLIYPKTISCFMFKCVLFFSMILMTNMAFLPVLLNHNCQQASFSQETHWCHCHSSPGTECMLTCSHHRLSWIVLAPWATHHAQIWAPGTATCAGSGSGSAWSRLSQPDDSPTGWLCRRIACSRASLWEIAEGSGYHRPVQLSE